MEENFIYYDTLFESLIKFSIVFSNDRENRKLKKYYRNVVYSSV